MKETSFNFTIFVEQINGCNVAHCLEMGLVAVNQDRDELFSIMNKLIVRQLQFALENENPADIYHSAPPDVWNRFGECMAQAQRQGVRPDSISRTVNAHGRPPIPVLCSQLSTFSLTPVYA
jgi:hypothetical protein